MTIFHNGEKITRRTEKAPPDKQVGFLIFKKREKRYPRFYVIPATDSRLDSIEATWRPKEPRPGYSPDAFDDALTSVYRGSEINKLARYGFTWIDEGRSTRERR